MPIARINVMQEAAFRTVIEPFRIKVVEPIPQPSLEARKAALAAAEWNLFRVPAGSGDDRSTD